MRPAAPHLILVPTTACDLACEHCFVSRPGATMSLETLREVARAYADLARSSPRRKVFWQGGELLALGPDWVGEAVAAVDEAFARASAPRPRHALQTNLLAYDASWDRLFREAFGGRVATSFDHPNLWRRRPGVGARELEAAWADRYRALRRAGFVGSVIAVLSSESLEVGPERFLARFFDDLGAVDLQVNLPMPGPGGRAAMADPRDPALAAFVRRLHDEWRRRHRPLGRHLFPVEAFEAVLRPGRRADRLPCAWSRDCGAEVVAVGPDGRAGPCDYWVAGPRDLCYGSLGGSSLGDLLRGEARAALAGRADRVRSAACGACPYLGLCHGGCPARAHAWLSDPFAPDPYCEVYKAFVEDAGELVLAGEPALRGSASGRRRSRAR